MVLQESKDIIRACKAFIEALRRTDGMMFSEDEMAVSDTTDIGGTIICKIEAFKDNTLKAFGMAYIYPDLVVVCVECVWDKFNEFTCPHHYEYISC